MTLGASGARPSGPAAEQPQRRVPDGLAMGQGKLQEIDLGDEVRSRNVAMTERARRRLEGGDSIDDEDDDTSGADKGKKVRFGPDGKPWRGRKRRGSEDIKRDQIVEDFLHENKRKLSVILDKHVDCQLTLYQWTSMKPRPRRAQPAMMTMTWQATTASQRNSNRALLTPCRRGAAASALPSTHRGCRQIAAMLRPRCLRARSLVGAGTRGQPCAMFYWLSKRLSRKRHDADGRCCDLAGPLSRNSLDTGFGSEVTTARAESHFFGTRRASADSWCRALHFC